MLGIGQDKVQCCKNTSGCKKLSDNETDESSECPRKESVRWNFEVLMLKKTEKDLYSDRVTSNENHNVNVSRPCFVT